jgi:hypothetical protein
LHPLVKIWNPLDLFKQAKYLNYRMKEEDLPKSLDWRDHKKVNKIRN